MTPRTNSSTTCMPHQFWQDWQWLQILNMFGCEFYSITTTRLCPSEYIMIDTLIHISISHLLTFCCKLIVSRFCKASVNIKSTLIKVSKTQLFVVRHVTENRKIKWHNTMRPLRTTSNQWKYESQTTRFLRKMGFQKNPSAHTVTFPQMTDNAGQSGQHRPIS